MGASVFIDANIVDNNKMILDIGLGVMVELNLAEAVPIVKGRILHLNE